MLHPLPPFRPRPRSGCRHLHKSLAALFFFFLALFFKEAKGRKILSRHFRKLLICLNKVHTTSLTLPVLKPQVKVLAEPFQSNIPRSVLLWSIIGAASKKNLLENLVKLLGEVGFYDMSAVLALLGGDPSKCSAFSWKAAGQRKEENISHLPTKKRLYEPCRTTLWKFYNSCCFCQRPHFSFW